MTAENSLIISSVKYTENSSRELLLAEPSVGKQAALTRRAAEWRRPTAESVSVPYSSPMFDVQDVSRFYRCSISDVHIGRSLHSTPHLTCLYCATMTNILTLCYIQNVGVCMAARNCHT